MERSLANHSHTYKMKINDVDPVNYCRFFKSAKLFIFGMHHEHMPNIVASSNCLKGPSQLKPCNTSRCAKQ